MSRSRHIPKHVKDAVRERSGGRCEICHRFSEYMEYDHLNPFSIGGLATVDNIQYICRKCNLEKSDKKPKCEHCGHWIPYKAVYCQVCSGKQSKTVSNYGLKHSSGFFTLRRIIGFGILGFLFIGVLFPACGVAILKLIQKKGTTQTTSQGQRTLLVNSIFQVSSLTHYPIRFVVQNNTKLVGGFKVTQGSKIDFGILNEAEYQSFTQSGSLNNFSYLSNKKIDQPLQAGSYYIVFNNAENVLKEVGAEIYLEYR